MNCDVCNKQIRKKHIDDGNYSHFYYLDGKTYFHEYQDYDKLPHLTVEKSKYDVMVCSECYIKNFDEISIKKYIPKKQYKKYCIEKIKKKKKGKKYS